MRSTDLHTFILGVLLLGASGWLFVWWRRVRARRAAVIAEEGCASGAMG